MHMVTQYTDTTFLPINIYVINKIMISSHDNKSSIQNDWNRLIVQFIADRQKHASSRVIYVHQHILKKQKKADIIPENTSWRTLQCYNKW